MYVQYNNTEKIENIYAVQQGTQFFLMSEFIHYVC